MDLQTTAGLILLVIAFSLLVLLYVFTSPARRRTWRVITPFRRLRRSIGLAVEQGTRAHISLGSASITEPESASALVGLASLERISEISSVSDRPPLATSGHGTLALLSKDSMKAAYQKTNVPELIDPDSAILAGPTPLSYIAGTIPLVHTENISANILVGDFGPEVALLAQAAGRENQFLLAGSNSLPAQAVMYASAQEPLIGEELFALPTYLEAGRIYESSLLAQDMLRWILILALLAGSVLVFTGVL